jgi:hypothetical protein
MSPAAIRLGMLALTPSREVISLIDDQVTADAVVFANPTALAGNACWQLTRPNRGHSQNNHKHINSRRQDTVNYC